MFTLETENIQLTGQVAIVTGGGRGIGRAIALALAKAGMRVTVAARSRDQLDETVALVQQQGGQALSFVLDVTDHSAVGQMVVETEQKFGPIDLLVNNAAISGDLAPLWENDA